MDLCEEAVQIMGMWVFKRWLEQEGLDISVAQLDEALEEETDVADVTAGEVGQG